MLSNFAKRTLINAVDFSTLWIILYFSWQQLWGAACDRRGHLYHIQVTPNPSLMPPSHPGSEWCRIICKGENLVKAVNFHNVLEHKSNELHITSDWGHTKHVSWYIPSIQDKAVNLLGIHKEMKSFYWLLTDNFSYTQCINSCLINSSGTNWAVDLVDPRLFDLIIRKSLSV